LLGPTGFSVLMTADGALTGYRVRAQGRALDQAAGAVREAMAPLSIDEIKRGVAMLSARCSVANSGDTALRVAALVEALAEMPADLAADVLTNWHRENQWLPTAAEVWKRHGWRVKQRQMLMDALMDAKGA
jgi:hypothetical protein